MRAPIILANRARVLWSVAGSLTEIAQAAFILCMQNEMA